LAVRVLIVDDEPAVRSVATDALSDAGDTIAAAADADQALHVLTHDESAVDVLFTDVRIPGGMNGLELARVAKRKWPGLHIIVTSGYLGDDFAAPEFLAKPWSASELVSRVAQAVA
jgi:CheY-like chemotaxis protein